MNTSKMVEQIQRHPVCCEIGIELQWGMPSYRVVQGKLHACFILYRQKAKEGSVCIFQPVYQVDFVYPFRHLSIFENLCLQGNDSARKIACRMSEQEYCQKFLPAMERLRHKSDELLEAYEDSGANMQRVVEYQQMLYNEMISLGMEKVYLLEA